MPNFGPVLIVSTVFEIVIVWLVVSANRQRNKARQSAENSGDKAAEIVREAVGELPETGPASAPIQSFLRECWKCILGLCVGTPLIYLAIYGTIGVAIRIIAPQLTRNESVLSDNVSSLIIPLVSGYLVLPLIVRQWILWPSKKKFSRRDENILGALGLIKWIAVLSASIAMIVIVDLAYGWKAAFVTFVANYLLFALLWHFFNKRFFSFAQYWVNRAIAKADYDEALRRVTHFESKYSEKLATDYYRGTILLFAGNYVDAEQLLRRSLAEAVKANRLQADIMVNLGYAFLRQGRYDEATRAYEGVIKINPNSGQAYNGLAEVCLFQGIEPQKALDYVVHFMRVTPKRQVRVKSTWGAIRGDEAWALAMLGRNKDAREAIGLAFEMTDKSFKPGVASLRFKEGKVFQIHGDRTHAEKSFNHAVQLDPVGMYGQLARSALAELQSD